MFSMRILFVYCRTKNLWPIQSSIQYHVPTSDPVSHQAFFDKDLHVFVKNQDQVDQSVKTFKELYSTRTRKSREFWLLDISEWTKKDSEDELNNQIRSDFVDMPLDLDDDLYFFSGRSFGFFHSVSNLADPKLWSGFSGSDSLSIFSIVFGWNLGHNIFPLISL